MFIQNSPLEGPGALAKLFDRDGLNTTIIPVDGKIPNTVEGPLVILGGPQSANDSSARLRDQESLIKWCHARNVPVLGICLGSQLAARALGGEVRRGHVREVGFFDDIRVDTSSPFFEGATHPYTVFHWHNETFAMPVNSHRLAGSKSYHNQAFVCGSIVGLQFHLEIDATTLDTWAAQLHDVSLGSMRHIHDNLARVETNLNAFYAGYKHVFGL